MFEWLRDGGVFTWILLGLSVLALGFVLERFWALGRRRVLPPDLARLVDTADPATLRGACAATPSPLARLLVSILDHLAWSKNENLAALQVQARREVILLERGLVALEIIVGIAPLLGLVGTIQAIIPLFGDFGKAMAGDNTLLAKGIGAALNKTLLGLMVAIPALVAWSSFNKRVEVLAVELETVCDRLLRRHYLKGGDAPAAGPGGVP